MPITVIIADDHDIIREGIKSVLKTHSEYAVIAEARDGEEALDFAREYKPDILLLDISMPKVSGLDIIERVKTSSLKTKIIIISVHKMGAYVLKAMRKGVSGYLNKDCVVEELIPALSRVVSGKTYLCASVSDYLADIVGGRVIAKPPKAAEAISFSQILNEREQDVLRLTAQGKTAKETAEILFLSRRTIENYKNNILKKLNLHKTSDLIKYALEQKIIDSEE